MSSYDQVNQTYNYQQYSRLLSQQDLRPSRQTWLHLSHQALLFFSVFTTTTTNTWAAIVHLSVPRTVNVDQMDEAILDCQYDYSTNLDDYLVVRWYLNDIKEPIYTWLPHSNTRTFNKLYEPFIDKSYRFSGESYEVYRGIRFTNLHPNLTGIYFCSVWSKWGRFKERKPMTLYRNPHFTKFELKSLSASVVSIECDVERIMRPAQVRLYRLEEHYFTALDSELTLVSVPNDRFQSATAMLKANYTVPSSPQAGTPESVLQFQCAVVYPNSDVNITRNELMLVMNAAEGRCRRTWWDVTALTAPVAAITVLVRIM
ncbi:hypothetical protein BIW11_08242 [Tropilaelaps mercedesae]|uniref:Uncharacterized protein n=1 Tax=Tropilaelaps mercedesae TaxID=418985 RepID=A0A1V9XQQ0_9ACAR|nr:hypothetical protein BIW11_08242 [Tropilaelaps mercedesae]